ncbi:disintegrin and metalloproteinase domain-containing protein 20-like [Suncus etruscus]|uniref:disintegrin and metalloproteinase domain-containing protein 20-like n=1 Tax=Suncus etruscus TaxID=109475 RepID=UPI00210F9372|nr:disintegrin and metalloproteinase domain-containing protein 20-like [Suncus etruscus]
MQLLLLWLEVLIFHSECSRVLHSQEKGRPEVMIPLKITDSDSSKKSSEWVSYSMKLDGLREVVHIKVIKHLLARNMPVFTYTDQGTLHQEHPFIQSNCYYYGYVEADPFSHVSLDTCFGGFQGILQKSNTVYKIEPKLNSTTFEHLVYKLVSEKKEFPARRFGLTDEESQWEFKIKSNDQLITSEQSQTMGWWTHKRYFKLASVVGHLLYRDYQSNITLTISLVMSLLSKVSRNYMQFDLTVILMGIEIWTDKLHILYSSNQAEIIHSFELWKKRNFNQLILHNVAVLIYRAENQKYEGYAYPGTACRSFWNSAILCVKKDNTIDYTAFILTRVIATTLDINIDTENCACGLLGDWCIMNDGNIFSIIFSNCSYSDYYKAYLNCLSIPPPREEIAVLKACGNGKVEEGEDCDCGTISSCANDTCCETNCKMAPEAVCAFGLCCRKCNFLPAGTLCRKEENECDLPEWCNGTYHECPEDVYVQGGLSCKGGGFCYGKRCNNREEQCRGIFGNQAKSASLTCYIDVNSKGDRFGNCGFNTTFYKPCPLKDSLCGRIQCENIETIPFLQNHLTFISTNINGLHCWGVDYHYGAYTPDVGEVVEGTECGENHICVERHCVHISYFTTHCDPMKCNMHGICNNRHHCHCNPAWGPPYCYEMGVGGSIDSGPPPASYFPEAQNSTLFEVLPTDFYLLLQLRFMNGALWGALDLGLLPRHPQPEGLWELQQRARASGGRGVRPAS